MSDITLCVMPCLSLSLQGEEPAAEEGGSEGHGPMAAVLVPPYRVSVMWTAWVFLKTFFSSLIPEVAQGMAN